MPGSRQIGGLPSRYRRLGPAAAAGPLATTPTAAAGGTGASGTVALTPATTPPATGTVTTTRAEWKQGLLKVTTGSSPNAIANVCLHTSDSLMFPLTNKDGGTYEAEHRWLDNPQSSTARSNLGGSDTATT
ncbi:MAG: hypothetical protein HOY69_10945 [Streptomyces sp.]|nr:hypothetical protein [Streptomyces sp.]